MTGVVGAASGSRSVAPRACTTALEVRERALWRVLELRAIADREERLLGLIVEACNDPVVRGAVQGLQRLVCTRKLHAEAAAGYLDECVARLEEAERSGDYDPLLDPIRLLTSGRAIAQRICMAVDTLVAAAADGPAARADLHALFEVFGGDLLEQRVAYHVGKHRLVVLGAELAAWHAAAPVDMAQECAA